MLTIEQIVEIAKENGASIDYNSDNPGIGYTNQYGKFKIPMPFDDDLEIFDNNDFNFFAA